MQPRQLLTDFLSINNQSVATEQRLNHESIALYLHHTLKLSRDATYVLAGSEDLRAILPKLKLEEEGDEVFIYIRPYTHSMAIYCRFLQGRLHTYIFDSQSWSTRYYPTRLMIDAINQHYPDAVIILSGTQLQNQDNQRGCIAYALAFLEYCKTDGLQFFENHLNNLSSIKKYPNTFIQAENDLPVKMLETSMRYNPNWAEDEIEHISQQVDEILYLYISDERRLDLVKIKSVVRDMQGVNLPCRKMLDRSSLYDIQIDSDNPSITFILNEDFIFSNFLIYSTAIYPSLVDRKVSTIKRDCSFDNSRTPVILLNNRDDISVTYNQETYSLTYAAESLAVLKEAFESLTEDVDNLYQRHMRQQTALFELIEEVKLHLDFHYVKQDETGGLDQYKVQLALAYEFENHPEVYVPNLTMISGDQAYLPLSSLAAHGYQYVAFTQKLNKEHQVGVWIVLGKDKHSVIVVDSESNRSLTDRVRQRLCQILNVDMGDITQQASPYDLQYDDWSCGVHIPAMLFGLHHASISAAMPAKQRLDVERLGLKYYRCSLIQDKKNEKIGLEHQENEAKLREFLEVVETNRDACGFYANKDCKPGDEFKEVADFLQGVAWGNTDRTDTPFNNHGRSMRALSYLINQPLDVLYSQFLVQHKNTQSYSSILFQLYILLVVNEKVLTGKQLVDALYLLSQKVAEETLTSSLYYNDEWISRFDAQLLLQQEITQFVSAYPARKSYVELLSQIFINIDDPLWACLTIVMQEQDPNKIEEAKQAIESYAYRMPMNEQYTLILQIINYIRENHRSDELEVFTSQHRMRAEYQAYLSAHQQDEEEKKGAIAFLAGIGVTISSTYLSNTANTKKILRQMPVFKRFLTPEYFTNLTEPQATSLLERLFNSPSIHTSTSLIKACPVEDIYRRSLISELANIDVDWQLVGYLIPHLDSHQSMGLLNSIVKNCSDEQLTHNATLLLKSSHLLSTVLNFDALLMRPNNLVLLLKPNVIFQLESTYICQDNIAQIPEHSVNLLLSDNILPLISEVALTWQILFLKPEDLSLINKPQSIILLEEDLIPFHLFTQYAELTAKFLNNTAVDFLRKRIYPNTVMRYIYTQLSTATITVPELISISLRLQEEISVLLATFASMFHSTGTALTVGEIIIKNLRFFSKYLPKNFYHDWSSADIITFVTNFRGKHPKTFFDLLSLLPQNRRVDFVGKLLQSFDVNQEDVLSNLLDYVDHQEFINILYRIVNSSINQRHVNNAKTLLSISDMSVIENDTSHFIRKKLLLNANKAATIKFMLSPGRYEAAQNVQPFAISYEMINMTNSDVLEYLASPVCDDLIKLDPNLISRSLELSLTMLRMYVAMKLRDVARLQDLIHQGGNINEVIVDSSATLLHYTSDDDDTEGARLLISLGANARNESKTYQYKESILLPPVMAGNYELLCMLIAVGADVNCYEHDLTPLKYAIDKNEVGMIRALIAAGVNPSHCMKGEDSPLMHALLKGSSLQLISLLVDSGANLDYRDNKGLTVLGLACQRDDYADVVEFFIKARADINLSCIDGNSPAHIAASYGSVGVLRLLLDAGVDIHQENNDGYKPLHIAIQHQHHAIAKMLLEAGPNYYAPSFRHSPVLLTYKHADTTMLELLLQYGFNANEIHPDGLPLLIAAGKLACTDAKYVTYSIMLAEHISMSEANLKFLFSFRHGITFDIFYCILQRLSESDQDPSLQSKAILILSYHVDDVLRLFVRQSILPNIMFENINRIRQICDSSNTPLYLSMWARPESPESTGVLSPVSDESEEDVESNMNDAGAQPRQRFLSKSA